MVCFLTMIEPYRDNVSKTNKDVLKSYSQMYRKLQPALLQSIVYSKLAYVSSQKAQPPIDKKRLLLCFISIQSSHKRLINLIKKYYICVMLMMRNH